MTLKRIIRRRQARADTDAAIEYYLGIADQSVALGFIDALDDALHSIRMYPQAGSARYAEDADLAGLRFWPLRRYPYLILYFDRDDGIDVWRLLHANQDIARHLSELD